MLLMYREQDREEMETKVVVYFLGPLRLWRQHSISLNIRSIPDNINILGTQSTN